MSVRSFWTPAVTAALRLERWEQALSLNAEVVASKKARGASALEVARTRYNDYGPLIRLGRYGEAHALLMECREVFESEGDLPGLGMVFSALATSKTILVTAIVRSATSRLPCVIITRLESPVIVPSAISTWRITSCAVAALPPNLWPIGWPAW